MERLCVHVCVCTVHPSMCTCVCIRVCERVGHCRNTGGAWTCFQLKAEAPTTKALAGGVVTRRISFFFGLCDLPFLRFTFKARLAGRSPQLHISDGKKERCPLPLLTSRPLFHKIKWARESERNEKKKKSLTYPLLAMDDKISIDVLEVCVSPALKGSRCNPLTGYLRPVASWLRSLLPDLWRGTAHNVSSSVPHQQWLEMPWSKVDVVELFNIYWNIWICKKHDLHNTKTHLNNPV